MKWQLAQAQTWLKGRFWLWLSLAAFVGSASAACRKPVPLAVLIEIEGDVWRDTKAAPQDWMAAWPRHTFAFGDGIKTGRQGGARLTLSNGSILDVKQDTVLRFLTSAPQETNFDVELGEVLLETGAEPLRLRSGVGLAVIEPRSQILIGRDGSKSRYEVVVGLALFQQPGAPDVVVRPGQRVVVDVQTAQIELAESTTPDADSVAKAEAAPPVPPLAEASDGEDADEAPASNERSEETAKEHLDVLLAAGESASIHAPSPPATLGIALPSNCARGLRLRVGSRSVMTNPSAAHVTVRLPAGTHRYVLLCGGSAVARGSLSVLRDAGTAALPRMAPASLVDTDGRNYTILYQNRLPQVQLRWPGAPASDKYELTLSSNGSERKFVSPTPSYTFQSGHLREGSYEVRFRATVGGQVKISRPTTMQIGFDNAAPAAVVRMPIDRKFRPGDTIDVSGVALAGWKVTALGAPLGLDPQHRFAGQLHIPAQQRALAIRFEHRDRGVHYYVRRAESHPQ